MKTNFYGGCIKSPKDSRDIVITPLLMDVITPELFSRREEMSPIKSQGKLGSCTGFAGIGFMEWAQIIDYKLTPETYLDLSEQFLYQEARIRGGYAEGANLRDIVKVLTKQGVCEERYYPYSDTDIGKPLDGAYENASKYCVEDLKYARITNVDELEKAIFYIAPVIAGVYVYQNWMKQKNGYIPNKSWYDWKPLGGHAICLVGYNRRAKVFEFRNSWDKEWGNEGYGFLTYQTVKDSLIDSFALVDIQDDKDLVRLGGKI